MDLLAYPARRVNRTQAIAFGLGFLVALLAFSTLSILTVPGIKNGRKVVVFFGDSITQHAFDPEKQGFVAHFGNFWSRRVDVFNRGYSGYNSRWGLQIVEDAVLKLRPDLTFVFFGANDAVVDGVVHHVPLEEYRDNLVNIVRRIQKTGTLGWHIRLAH
jgi:lysophospholipase L1-like esterase